MNDNKEQEHMTIGKFTESVFANKAAATEQVENEKLMDTVASVDAALEPVTIDNAEQQQVSVQNAAFELGKNENVNLEYSYSAISKNQPLNIANDGIALLAERQTLETAKRVDEFFSPDNKNPTVNYAVTYDAATKVAEPKDGMFRPTLDRAGSQWSQYLQTERGKIAFMSPKLADGDSKKVAGKKALLRVRSLMGMGGLVSIPLFRSGFWITIKTPSEASLIELNRRIGEEKIALGRQTHGLAFSNNEAFMTGWLVDFALANIYESNLKNEEDLRAKIEVIDIPMIIWGLAVAIYPRGFNYSRAITTPNGVRNRELVTALINVTKMLWVDNSYFSDQHKTQMSLRQADSITDEMLETYKKTMRLGEGREVELFEGVKVVIKVPTVSQQVDSTHRWVTDLNNIIDETFTQSDPDDEDRNNMLAIHARTSQARTYSPWVESIIVEGEETITASEDIEEFLTMLSEKQEATKTFIDEIKRFINDATCAIIAIPETSGQVDESLPQFPQLIPINVPSVFFILLVQSVNRIISKKSLV